jgi:alpha-tubulin suppressor-like RCC1 family protein
MLKNVQNKSNLFSVFIIAAITLFISQAVFASGYIKIWGEYVFDGREFDCNDFVAIAAGYGHSLAIKEDGSIVGWGYNHDGQTTVPDGND